MAAQRTNHRAHVSCARSLEGDNGWQKKAHELSLSWNQASMVCRFEINTRIMFGQNSPAGPVRDLFVEAG